MKTNQEKVEEFHRAMGMTIPVEPMIPPVKIMELRYSLHKEECVTEFIDALGRCVAAKTPEQEKEAIKAVADSIGDALYVIYGSAIDFGLDAQAIFDRVHASNMTKFIDGHLNSAGKWVKGPSFVPPVLDDLITKPV